jgi:hypothetical protein
MTSPQQIDALSAGRRLESAGAHGTVVAAVFVFLESATDARDCWDGETLAAILAARSTDAGRDF